MSVGTELCHILSGGFSRKKTKTLIHAFCNSVCRLWPGNDFDSGPRCCIGDRNIQVLLQQVAFILEIIAFLLFFGRTPTQMAAAMNPLTHVYSGVSNGMENAMQGLEMMPFTGRGRRGGRGRGRGQ